MRRMFIFHYIPNDFYSSDYSLEKTNKTMVMRICFQQHFFFRFSLLFFSFFPWCGSSIICSIPRKKDQEFILSIHKLDTGYKTERKERKIKIVRGYCKKDNYIGIYFRQQKNGPLMSFRSKMVIFMRE